MCLDPVRVKCPQVGGGMFSQFFKRKRSTVGWVLDGCNAQLTVPPGRKERKTVRKERKTYGMSGKLYGMGGKLVPRPEFVLLPRLAVASVG